MLRSEEKYVVHFCITGYSVQKKAIKESDILWHYSFRYSSVQDARYLTHQA